MKVKDILSEIANDADVSEEYLISEYNSLIRTLHLMLPESDGVLTSVASDGIIETTLLKEQVRRVIYKDSELLRASDTLRTLLPNGRLFTPADNRIFVTVRGECKVFYRSLPEEVKRENLDNTEFPFAGAYIPLMRAWLWHRTYLYIGDFDSADVYSDEFNRLLDVFCAENGVQR